MQVLASTQTKSNNNVEFGKLREKKPTKQSVTTSKQLECDLFDDGKISTKNKAKYFIKGIVSPFTTLISSPKNLILGGAVIIGGGLLCAALPPLIPVMTAIGIATGGLQLAKGSFKALTAKTDEQAKKAWEGIGSGTFALGTSAISAKTSLKASGLDDSANIKLHNAIIKCFKDIPQNISKSFKMIKNKTAFTNFKNTFIKPISEVDANDIEKLKKLGYGKEKLDELKQYSEILNEEGLKATQALDSSSGNGCIDELVSILPENLKSKLSYRVKSPSSIKDKLINRMSDDKTKATINSLEDARNQIGDLIGARVSLEDVDNAQMEALIDSLASALRKRQIKFVEIDNYRGEGIKPYFSTDHIDTLREAAKANKMDFDQFEGFGSWQVSNKVKHSGYTTAQINVQYNDGTLGEFQIRGKGIQKLADIEHIPYDLRQSKDLSGGNSLLKTLYAPLESHVKTLSNKGYDEYNRYLNALYKYYRNTEIGHKGLHKPKIRQFMKSSPEEILNVKEIPDAKNIRAYYNEVINILDIGNIENLHTEASWLKELPRTTILKSLLGGSNLYIAGNSINNET